ncbi:MAG: IS21 family transposase [Candidatus Cloacimonetes bacterium]|nr:IS21 family transposase [Candidatus Cloacimonadota bacterium]
MIDKSVAAEIVRLFHVEKWPVNTIATQLGVHHTTVERAIDRHGLPRPKAGRPSKLDAYLDFIDRVLTQHPRLCASRLHRMCVERGYAGSESHFRRIIRGRRPRPPAEAYLRLRTLPGDQAQVDWGYFGKVQIGKATRRLIAFAMVLSYSRMLFVRFFLGDHTDNFLRGHVAAFREWGGCPRRILYDNLKSAVIERRGDAIRRNPRIVEFAGHYHYEMRPVAIARGNEKGRVERAIRYVRDSFFAARTWKDVDDLNAQAAAWCTEVAAQRRWPQERDRVVRDVFEQDERPRLLELPGDDFACDERCEVAVGKTPYVRFDTNDYSVPADHVRRTLTVVATLSTVRVLDGVRVVAEHERSFDRGAQIEDPRHVQELLDRKRRARRDRGIDRLAHAVPSSQLLMTSLAERGENLGSATSWMLRLIDEFGATAVEKAVVEAIAHDAPHPQAVRHILDRQRREMGRPPSTAVELPDDPRVRNLAVRPHDLSGYDRIAQPERDEEAAGDDR